MPKSMSAGDLKAFLGRHHHGITSEVLFAELSQDMGEDFDLALISQLLNKALENGEIVCRMGKGRVVYCQGVADIDEQEDLFSGYEEGFVAEVSGVITISTRGFGFVKTKATEVEIFVKPGQTCGSMSGDTVVADCFRDGDGQINATVTGIASRAVTELVGLVCKSGGQYLLDPCGRALGCSIVIRGAGLEDDGQIVCAAVVAYPQKHGDPLVVEGTRRLGPMTATSTAIPAVCAEFGISTEFPSDVQTAAQQCRLDLSPEAIHTRTDYRSVPFVTIDGADSRDMDDAVHLEPLSSGGWLLRVAIADVAHYVLPGTPLDREARSRGTSVYFPGKCIPMLPVELSNDLCSLNPDCDRYSMVATILLAADGTSEHDQVEESIIRSHRRLTYDHVDDVLSGRKVESRWLTDMLHEMDRCRQVLTRKRQKRGAMVFEASEMAVEMDGDEVQRLVRHERTTSHELIEQFMLEANEAVAGLLADTSRPYVCRAHPMPERERVAELRKVVTGMGYDANYKPSEGLSSYLKAALAHFAGSPEEEMVRISALRTMARARYEVAGFDGSLHFGLGTWFYTHFTSPIRRYPDLLVHRQLKLLLRGQEDKWPEESYLAEETQHASARERVASDADRALTRRLVAGYMAPRVGDLFNAVVSGVSGAGLYIETEGVEGLIPRESLGRAIFRKVTGTFSVGSTSFRVGTPVLVKMQSVDLLRRQINFKLIARNSLSASDQVRLCQMRRKGRDH